MMRRCNDPRPRDNQTIDRELGIRRRAQRRPRPGRFPVTVDPQNPFPGTVLQVHRARRRRTDSARASVRRHTIEIKPRVRIVDHRHPAPAARAARIRISAVRTDPAGPAQRPEVQKNPAAAAAPVRTVPFPARSPIGADHTVDRRRRRRDPDQPPAVARAAVRTRPAAARFVRIPPVPVDVVRRSVARIPSVPAVGSPGPVRRRPRRLVAHRPAVDVSPVRHIDRRRPVDRQRPLDRHLQGKLLAGRRVTVRQHPSGKHVDVRRTDPHPMMRRRNHPLTGNDQSIHHELRVRRRAQRGPCPRRFPVAVDPQDSLSGSILQVHRPRRRRTHAADTSVRRHVIQIEPRVRIVDHRHPAPAARAARIRISAVRTDPAGPAQRPEVQKNPAAAAAPVRTVPFPARSPVRADHPVDHRRTRRDADQPAAVPRPTVGAAPPAARLVRVPVIPVDVVRRPVARTPSVPAVRPPGTVRRRTRRLIADRPAVDVSPVRHVDRRRLIDRQRPLDLHLQGKFLVGRRLPMRQHTPGKHVDVRRTDPHPMMGSRNNPRPRDHQTIDRELALARQPQRRPRPGRFPVAVDPQHPFAGPVLQVHRARRRRAHASRAPVRRHVIQIEPRVRIVDHRHPAPAARAARGGISAVRTNPSRSAQCPHVQQDSPAAAAPVRTEILHPRTAVGADHTVDQPRPRRDPDQPPAVARTAVGAAPPAARFVRIPPVPVDVVRRPVARVPAVSAVGSPGPVRRRPRRLVADRPAVDVSPVRHVDRRRAIDPERFVDLQFQPVFGIRRRCRMGQHAAPEDLHGDEPVRPVHRHRRPLDHQPAAVVIGVPLRDGQVGRDQPGVVDVPDRVARRPVMVLVHGLSGHRKDVGADRQPMDAVRGRTAEIEEIPKIEHLRDRRRRNRRASFEIQPDVLRSERLVVDRFAEDDLDPIERLPLRPPGHDAGHVQPGRRFVQDHEIVVENVFKGFPVAAVRVLVHGVPRKVHDLRPHGKDVPARRRQRVERHNVTVPFRPDIENRARLSAVRSRQRHVVGREGSALDRFRKRHGPFEIGNRNRFAERNRPGSFGVDRHVERRFDRVPDPRGKPCRDRPPSIRKGNIRREFVRPRRTDRRHGVESAVAVVIDLDRPALVHGHVEGRRVVAGQVVVVRRSGIAGGLKIDFDRCRPFLDRQRPAQAIGPVKKRIARKVENGRRTFHGQPVVIVGKRLRERERRRLPSRIEDHAGQQGGLVDLVAVVECPVAAAADEPVIARVRRGRRIDSDRVGIGHPHLPVFGKAVGRFDREHLRTPRVDHDLRLGLDRRTDPGRQPRCGRVSPVGQNARRKGIDPRILRFERLVERPVAVVVDFDEAGTVDRHVERRSRHVRDAVFGGNARVAAGTQPQVDRRRGRFERDRVADVIRSAEQRVARGIAHGCRAPDGELIQIVPEGRVVVKRRRPRLRVVENERQRARRRRLVAVAERPVAAAGHDGVVGGVDDARSVHPHEIVVRHPDGAAFDRRIGGDPRRPGLTRGKRSVVAGRAVIRNDGSGPFIQPPQSRQSRLVAGELPEGISPDLLGGAGDVPDTKIAEFSLEKPVRSAVAADVSVGAGRRQNLGLRPRQLAVDIDPHLPVVVDPDGLVPLPVVQALAEIGVLVVGTPVEKEKRPPRVEPVQVESRHEAAGILQHELGFRRGGGAEPDFDGGLLVVGGNRRKGHDDVVVGPVERQGRARPHIGHDRRRQIDFQFPYQVVRNSVLILVERVSVQIPQSGALSAARREFIKPLLQRRRRRQKDRRRILRVGRSQGDLGIVAAARCAIRPESRQGVRGGVACSVRRHRFRQRQRDRRDARIVRRRPRRHVPYEGGPRASGREDHRARGAVVVPGSARSGRIPERQEHAGVVFHDDPAASAAAGKTRVRIAAVRLDPARACDGSGG